MVLLRTLLFLATCVPFAAWSIEQYTVRVVDQKPQSRENFVQGLEILDGYLYVSTGNYGHSHLLRYRLEDDQLDAGQKMHPRIFAEGLTVFGDSIYQLTWRNKVMLVYRKADLALERQLPLPGEGWGLTNNGTELIYGDGSENLYFMDPDSGKILRSIAVTQQNQPVKHLNELEWIDGQIWANVWQTDRIVIINPVNGIVTGSINLQGLLPPQEHRQGTDVLNGIARDPADGSVWVTGKHWPWLYQIELVPPAVVETTQSNADSR
jgi:glutamine cyclotransferase